MLIAWVNPRCSKSRALLERLRAAGQPFATRLYLEDAPTLAELQELQTALGLAEPSGMIRRKEAIFDELGLATASPEELLAAVVAHPILLQRPILVDGAHATIERGASGTN